MKDICQLSDVHSQLKSMHYTISTAALAEPILENRLPEGYHDPANPFAERRIAIENAMGKGLIHECFFEGMHIMTEEMRLVRDFAIRSEADYGMVILHFELCGHSVRSTNGFAYPDCAAGGHNILYAPAGKTHYRYSRAYRAFEVHLSAARFRSCAENMGAAFLDGFLEAIARQEPARLGRHNMPITPAMMQAVHAVQHCGRTGVYKRVFLEAKAMELFLMQLEQLGAHGCGASCPLRPDTVEKMHHARDIALRRLDRPLSLAELAREVGTNEFALKKGFRETFGATVFGTIAEAKMDRARELLLAGRMNVSEISDHLGYGNVANFSTAFKRRFGESPMRYRNGERKAENYL